MDIIYKYESVVHRFMNVFPKPKLLMLLSKPKISNLVYILSNISVDVFLIIK